MDIAVRSLAATVGAYVASYWFGRATARMLPIAATEAVILSSILALLLIVALAIWAFGCRSIGQLWLSLSGLTLACMAVTLWRWP